MGEDHDSRTWRARAEECRSIAAAFSSADMRARMLRIAGGYDARAEAAARRELEIAAGHSPADRTG